MHPKQSSVVTELKSIITSRRGVSVTSYTYYFISFQESLDFCKGFFQLIVIKVIMVISNGELHLFCIVVATSSTWCMDVLSIMTIDPEFLPSNGCKSGTKLWEMKSLKTSLLILPSCIAASTIPL